MSLSCVRGCCLACHVVVVVVDDVVSVVVIVGVAAVDIVAKRLFG